MTSFYSNEVPMIPARISQPIPQFYFDEIEMLEELEEIETIEDEFCLYEEAQGAPRYQSKLVKMFFKAIRLNDLDTIKDMVETEPKLLHPNFVDGRRKGRRASPLWTALLMGRVEIVQYFLDFGADPHERRYDRKGRRALSFLQYFAEADNWRDMTEMVEHLVGWGVSLGRPFRPKNLPAYGRCNPLETALYARNLECAEYLYEQGADLLYTGNGMINLAHAINMIRKPSLRRDTCMLLIKNGLIEKCREHKLDNILFYLMEVKCHHECHSQVSLCDVVSIFLDHGIDVNEVDFTYETSILSHAIMRFRFIRDLNLIWLLIERGANVEQRNYKDATPLHHAVCAVRDYKVVPVELIGMLVEAGADIHGTVSKDRTVMHAACKVLASPDPGRLIKYLIEEMDADINVVDANGRTPFYALYWWLNEKFIRRDRRVPYDDCHEYKCIKPIVKKLARQVFENRPYFKSDVRLVQMNALAQTVYDQCMQELAAMWTKKLFSSYTYGSFLATRDLSRLALITRNQDFRNAFIWNNTWDIYHRELLKQMGKAMDYDQRLRALMQIWMPVFRGILPELPVLKILNYLMD